MKPLYIALVSAVLICTASLSHATKVYSWVDEHGIKHFSAHPPKDTKVDIIKPKIGHSEPVSYQTASSQAAKTDNDNPIDLRDPTRCATAQRNLEVLNREGRMKAQREDGSFYYLTDDDKKQRKEETLIIIEESC